MRLFLLLMVSFIFALSGRAQVPLDATMISSLVATQGETITYTAVITNRTSNAITGVVFSDTLDPNTRFVPGSVNTSPLAFGDAFAALGNVQITIPAPGVLANDVDVDAVGPALTVTAATGTSANGGNVSIRADGSFTYNPPPGFEGTDSFTYQLNDGEGFADIGTVSMSVTGMIWFVNGAAPAGGDGRLTNPFNTLLALAGINNGAGNNPAAGDTIFVYSGNYAGAIGLLNNQKFIGQGAGASITSLTGLVPPPGSLALPATGGVRPGIAGVSLGRDNLVRGLNILMGGLVGGNVGALTVAEMAVTNTGAVGISFTGGALNVVLDSVSVNGGPTGIRLKQCTGSFKIMGDGSPAQNGTGGTIQSINGSGIQLEDATAVSIARMNITACSGNGISGQNVNGLVIDWCHISNNGDATDEGGIRLGSPIGGNGITGNARIANTLVRGSAEMNVAIYNSAGTLNLLDVTNVISKDTRLSPLGADGFYFETRGTAVAAVSFVSCVFSNNFTQGIQASALGQSALTVNVANCAFTNNNEGVVLANAAEADLVFDINNNRFLNNLTAGASGSAIAAVNATTVTSSASYSGRIRNNTIIGGRVDNHLITVLFAGAGNNALEVVNNNVNAVNAQFGGLFIQAGETGSGTLNANVTVTGNIVSLGALGSHGIAIQSRITSTLCAEIANNTSATAGLGLFGINVRQRDTSTFRLPGFAGPFNSAAAVTAFLQGKNPASSIGATVATAYSGGAACALPAPAPQPQFAPELMFEPALVSDQPSAQDEEVESSVNPASILGSVSDVNVNIGTLPGRKSITIAFRAMLRNPMPEGVCSVSNQGVITADSVSVVTDDPRTPGLGEPTVTAVRARPSAITLAASEITATSAMLNASVIPGVDGAGYYIIYRPSPGSGLLSGTVAGGNLLSGGCSPVPVAHLATGLLPNTVYNFNVVASNSLGFAFGGDVTFTTLPPSILQQPQDALVCAGSSAEFAVLVEGSGQAGRFQWQRLDPGASEFLDVPLATNGTYTIAPVSAADHGAAFRVVFTGAGVTLISDEAVLSVNQLFAPEVLYNFNSGVPPGTAIYGSAFVDAATGVLELNPNIGSQTGAFLTTDLAPGRLVRGFAASFRARLLGGSFPPADGFSFNWATDLPNRTYDVAEEGHGSGLSVAFDTYDNGFGEAPAIDVFWGRTHVASKPVSIPFLVRGPDFFDVQIRLSADGLLDVTYACEPVFTRLQIPGYTPQMGARFGIGSRTGGLWETHGIDDFALNLELDNTADAPRITSIALESSGALIRGTGTPNRNYSLERSIDLTSWAWRANVQADPDGLWQFLESDTGSAVQRFYRLHSVPQLPPGLVTWYRADGNYNDSFGPNQGIPEGSIGFAAGQRGQAFNLNGLTDAMFIGRASIPVPWTAALWVNRQDSPDVSAALLADGAAALKMEQWPSTRQVGITQFGVADHTFSYIIPAGAWVHVTVVGSASGTTLFIGGSPVQTIPVVINLPLQTLGRRDTGQDRLRGQLDEITIFNRELSPVEIQQVISTTRGP